MSASNILCINVFDNSSTESRYSLISWVNNTTGLRYKEVEEMCSGVAYCDMMHKLFPSCISSRRIKRDAKLEYEYVSNFKLFQAALVTVRCTKEVPIEQLVKGKFKVNLEFLQWFHKFFDANKDVDSAGYSEIQPHPVQKNRILGKSGELAALQKEKKILEKELVRMGEKVQVYLERLRVFKIQCYTDDKDSVVPSIAGILEEVD